MPHRIHKCTDTLYDYAKIINTYVSSMYELRNVLESKFVETGTSFYKKKNNLPGHGLTKVEKPCIRQLPI